MNVRTLMRRINDTLRPVHLKNQRPTYDPVDLRATARAGNLGTGGSSPAATTTWVPSQQDEEPHH